MIAPPVLKCGDLARAAGILGRGCERVLRVLPRGVYVCPHCDQRTGDAQRGVV